MFRRWLVKTSTARLPPEALGARRPVWHRGVRSPPSRRRLLEMRRGDEVLLQYTGSRPRIVARTKVEKAPHADRRGERPGDVVVVLAPPVLLARPVSLRELRSVASLEGWELLTFPRLSVAAVPREGWRRVLALAQRPRGPDGPT